MKELHVSYIIDDLIIYKQWDSTDRSNLEECEDDFDEFFDKLQCFLSWQDVISLLKNKVNF